MRSSALIPPAVILLSSLVVGCAAGTAREPDAGPSPDAPAAMCSAASPDGLCPTGQRCREGSCLDEDLFCSDARPSGLCPSDERCFEGSCVPMSTLCSEANPGGLCPGALVCREGLCTTDAPCAPTEPLGYCASGQACLDGACVARSELCSSASPMGRCPTGQACVDAICVDETSLCAPERPAGLCPTGSSCVNGACVSESERCSPSNPTGACPTGQSCVGGACSAGDPMCSPANPTGSCPAGLTCASGACVMSGAPASCGDSMQNGLETDVDCGGPRCEPCATGRDCLDATDCRSLECTSNTCGAAVPRYTADEDFETGDLTRFPYEHQATNPWTIESDAARCHGGSYCLRTNVFHAGGETARITLHLSVREDTMISFWARTHSEPSEHYLRFLIDGAPQVEVSGDTEWTQYRVMVRATGAGGADRELTWEYSRSDFVDPGHAPWNEVWIDDIDLPAWNSQPSVPRLLWPGNGGHTTEAWPRFRWRSDDPDFDTIIYEMQLSTDPAFGAPATTGETMERTFRPSAPLADGSIYYWRARAKDDSDYRWSAWSPVSSVRVDTASPYETLFRHTTGSEFALGALGPGAEISGDRVRGQSSTFTRTFTVPTEWYDVSAATMLSDLPAARAGTSASLRVQSRFYGVCNQPPSQLDLSADGRSIGNIVENWDCVCLSSDRTITVTDIASLVMDGQMSITFDPHTGRPNQGYFCQQPVTGTLTYQAVGSGTYTSPPIYLTDLSGSNWEHVWMDATSGTTLTVLDADLVPIDDAQIPGNSAGLAPGVHTLWHLDAAAHPVIHLRASFDRNAELRGWEVTANDGYAFHFLHDAQSEGWQAADDGATPAASVTGGVLRVASTAAGSNPRLELRLPAPVEAGRFRELVVRLRTSNNHADDTVVLFWENNFGFFDSVRSASVTDFLFAYQDVTFDLSATPTPPQQPWQGRIAAIRVDPAVRFTNPAGAPADGWAEIESIWLR